MNAIVGTINLDQASVLDRSHPPIIDTLPAKAANGILAEGALVAKDEDGEIILHGEATPVAMTGAINGTNDDFTATLTPAPVLPGSVLIANNNAAPQEIVDDGYGRLKGDGTGTVDYATGAVVAAFTTPPETGKTVLISHKTKPVGVLITELDTASDDAAPVIVHGTVVKEKLSVGAGVPDAEDIAALKATGVFAR